MPTTSNGFSFEGYPDFEKMNRERAAKDEAERLAVKPGSNSDTYVDEHGNRQTIPDYVKHMCDIHQPTGDEVRLREKRWLDEKAEEYRLQGIAAAAKAEASKIDEQLAALNRQMAETAANPKPLTDIEWKEAEAIHEMHRLQEQQQKKNLTAQAKHVSRQMER